MNSSPVVKNFVLGDSVLIDMLTHPSLPKQALSIAVEEGDTVSQALTNGNLGIAFQSLGDTVSALQHLDTHLAIARECGNTDAQTKGLGNLGSFYLAKEDLSTALELFGEQLDLAKETGKSLLPT